MPLTATQAADVLRYWKLVEVLTPPLLETSLVADYLEAIQPTVVSDADLPWHAGPGFVPRADTDRDVWIHTVYLGIAARQSIINHLHCFLHTPPPCRASLSAGLTALAAFKVVGAADGQRHWIRAEGEQVVAMLQHGVQRYGQLPPWYVIAPYRQVAYGARALLKQQWQQWAAGLGMTGRQIEAWLKGAVGTIHTFQGKETEGVILLLGGNVGKPAALDWVAQTPNMLNVALTRAKYFCWVVGNRQVWSQRPYFHELASTLPRIAPQGTQQLSFH